MGLVLIVIAPSVNKSVPRSQEAYPEEREHNRLLWKSNPMTPQRQKSLLDKYEEKLK